MRLPTFLSERLGSLKSRKGLTSRLAADGETPAAIAAAAAFTAAAALEDVRVFIGAMGGEGSVVKLFVGERVLVDTVFNELVDAGEGDCLGAFEGLFLEFIFARSFSNFEAFLLKPS